MVGVMDVRTWIDRMRGSHERADREEALRCAAMASAEAAAEGWFTAWDGAIRVDVFVPSIEFSWEARATRQQLDFLGENIWFLSAEALCVFKLLFFRTKDLADLEQLVMTSATL